MSRCCDELALCQERKQACPGCPANPLQLAPGVVEGYRVPLLGAPAQRRERLRWAKSAAWWITWSGLAVLAAGLIAGVFA